MSIPKEDYSIQSQSTFALWFCINCLESNYKLLFMSRQALSKFAGTGQADSSEPA